MHIIVFHRQKKTLTVTKLMKSKKSWWERKAMELRISEYHSYKIKYRIKNKVMVLIILDW